MNQQVEFTWDFLKNVSEALDSYRVRSFIDAKEDIINAGVYTEQQYFSILFKMIDEEKVKFQLFDYLKKHHEKGISIIQQFSEDHNVEYKKTHSLLKLLEAEGLISIKEIYEFTEQEDGSEDRSQEYTDLLITIRNTSPSTIRPIYEPVKIIFNSKICSGCGLCAGICPMDCITIQNGHGEIDEDKCIRCGLCYLVCPRSFLPVNILNLYQEDDSKLKKYEQIGHFLEAYSARTKIKEIREVCQDGGISSTCLLHLFNTGEIDFAIGAKIGDKPWCPEPVLIQNKDDIINAAGTKYVNNPNLKLLSELNTQIDKRIAVVGVPCMMQALLKSRIYDINLPSLQAVQYRIGIYCMESFGYENGFLKICEMLNVHVDDVRKTDINKGKFIIYTTNNEELSIPIKEINHLAREDCEVCYDLTSESADISVGSIGAPSGWNCVLIRTPKGKELFNDLVKNDLIEAKPISEVKPGIGLLKKIAAGKKKKSIKYINEKLEREDKVPIY
ncbi:MAG: Coenzyme F420 hydrogenase subunit beta [Promethearchaeota archaeon]|nr:MAG: Coenzyme F420 hydrogenase subunit beta [Candidatus Lokiarchaeota archaeon]